MSKCLCYANFGNLAIKKMKYQVVVEHWLNIYHINNKKKEDPLFDFFFEK